MTTKTKHPKYAPARPNGDKPYIVSFRDWRLEINKVVYAPGPQSARYKAMGWPRPGLYHKGTRRALWDEVPT